MESLTRSELLHLLGQLVQLLEDLGVFHEETPLIVTADMPMETMLKLLQAAA